MATPGANSGIGVTPDPAPAGPVRLAWRVATVVEVRSETERARTIVLDRAAQDLDLIGQGLVTDEQAYALALDPGYDGKRNTWVYLYYSPPLDTPADDPATASINEGDAPETGTAADFEPFEGHLTVARFRYSGGQVDLGSEQKVLDVPVGRLPTVIANDHALAPSLQAPTGARAPPPAR